MPTKRQKVTAEFFNRGVLDIPLALGARRIKHPLWEHAAVIETRCGPLEMHPATDPTSLNRPSGRRGVRSHAFTVFCRFKDIDKMRAGGCADMDGVNQYSGKYNYHAFIDSSKDAGEHVADAIDGFEAHIKRVL